MACSAAWPELGLCGYLVPTWGVASCAVFVGVLATGLSTLAVVCACVVAMSPGEGVELADWFGLCGAC
jgi:hypothetical protein